MDFWIFKLLLIVINTLLVVIVGLLTNKISNYNKDLNGFVQRYEIQSKKNDISFNQINNNLTALNKEFIVLKTSQEVINNHNNEKFEVLFKKIDTTELKVRENMSETKLLKQKIDVGNGNS